MHVCKLKAVFTANAYGTEREMSVSACTRSIYPFIYDWFMPVF